MARTTTRFLRLLCALSLGVVSMARAAYVPVVVTGFTDDIVANGAGPAAASTTADADNGSTGNSFAFMAPTFVNPSGVSPTTFLPATGLINSATLPGLSFQLASYSANNSLRIPNTGPGTGTLTLTTPQAAGEIYLLTMSGNLASTVTFTVNFSDGTSQVFAGQTISDWYDGMNYAILGVGRVNRATDAISNITNNPRLYQTRLALSAANYSKNIVSIGVNKTSTQGTLNVMGVTLNPACTGTPTAGAAVASVSPVCASTSTVLSLSGASADVGISYQWQVSTNGGTSWTDISGATNATYTLTGQTVASQYRARLTCASNAAFAFSTPVTVAQNPFYNCYCANVNTGTNEYINSVAVNTLNNVTNANSTGGYGDFTTNTALTTTLTQGSTYPFTLGARSNAPNSQGGVWIDYDQSGTFDASEFLLVGSSSAIATNVMLTANLVVPPTALVGTTRMRVRWRNSAFTGTTACTSGTTTWYGETEDYLVTIVSAVACNSAPPASTATASVGVICPSTSFTLGVNGIAAGTGGLSYQWMSSPAGANTFTNLGPAQTTAPYTVTNQTAPTDYRVMVTCTATSQSTTSSSVTVGDVLVSTTNTPLTICAGGTATLTATAAGGAGVQFFDAATGGTALNAAGTTSFTTPALTTSRQYFVGAVSGTCTSATRTPIQVNVNPIAPATFNYGPGNNTFCQAGTNPTPTITGTAGGTFSSTTGLSINASTGVINLASSTPGTYTVTYASPASSTACAGSGTQTVIITAGQVASFSYGTNTTFCQSAPNPTLTLSPGATSGTFSASPAGLSLSATTGAITLASSTPGTYTVTNTVAASGACAAATATQTVTVTAAPTATFTYPAGAICLGSATTVTPVLPANSVAGIFSVTPANGLSLNTSTGVINAANSTPGTYTVTNTVNGSGNCATTSATQTVVVNPMPSTPAVTVGGPLSFCQGGSVLLSAPTATGNTYQWLLGGMPIMGATNATYTATTSGAITVRVTNAGGCDATSTVTTVTAVPVPAAPTLTLTPQPDGSMLLTATGGPAGATYQFFLGGVRVTGTSGNVYLVNSGTKNGVYTVTTTVSNCASPASAPQTVTVTGTAAAKVADGLLLYPNPTHSGLVSLELSRWSQGAEVSVLNALGQVVLTRSVAPAATGSPVALDLSSLPAGVYLLRVRHEQLSQSLRLVRE